MHGLIHPAIRGYILAGGRSSRMGFDKRRLKIGGYSILERAGNLLEATLGRKPILAGDNLGPGLCRRYRNIVDAASDKGPLGGLISCLRDCAPEDWALILPVDMPYISQIEIEALINSINNNTEVVALGSGGKIEPLVGLYRREALPFWECRLQSGELSLQEGIKQLNYRIVKTAEDSCALKNINTLKDIECLIPRSA